ncbi:hypothetical protein J8J40_24130, partial [Mycobacterium tuberculosis]|nr:hypothetical protein [Mycobacterium tuberculosis]
AKEIARLVGIGKQVEHVVEVAAGDPVADIGEDREVLDGEADGVEHGDLVGRAPPRRLAGEDIAKGDEALPAGRRIGPREIALLAGLGVADVAVKRRPKVAVFSTGDEVAPPGSVLGPA